MQLEFMEGTGHPAATRRALAAMVNGTPGNGAAAPAGSRPGPHLDQNVLAGYAAVVLALILDPSGGLFSDAARPCQRPAPPFGANVALENRD